MKISDIIAVVLIQLSYSMPIAVLENQTNNAALPTMGCTTVDNTLTDEISILKFNEHDINNSDNFRDSPTLSVSIKLPCIHTAAVSESTAAPNLAYGYDFINPNTGPAPEGIQD
ncbi:hypothetical protein HK099_004816 [Clydaea vesicula]|uniref:Uncharacterized protein n=1 Tax=Clydaea vesicula TaxID=447962 RepID=A0AAD5TZS9_9FUNG|nr:hypothetical protein HK099_004816 [Clydaea vesicula]